MNETCAPRRLQRVPIDLVRPSRAQVRTEFSEESIARLADSIRHCGLLSPLVVRRFPDGQYELIAGERRLRALRQLGAGRADALVLSAGDRDAALMTLVENLQREPLHYLEEAAAYRALIETYHFSQQELASHLGRSQPCIANRLRLLRLPEAVRARLMHSTLGERHARAVLCLQDEHAQLRVLERAEAESLSARQTEALVQRMAEPKPRPVRRLMRDDRLYVNAVLNAVKALNRAGVPATSHVLDHPDCIEVVVRLPKDAMQAGRGRENAGVNHAACAGG